MNTGKTYVTIRRMMTNNNPNRPESQPDDVPLRRIPLWLPDTRAPGFAAEARRQSLLVAQRPDEQDIVDLLEAAISSSSRRILPLSISARNRWSLRRFSSV